MPPNDDATAARQAPATIDLDASNVLVEKRFSEAIFPTLTSVGEVRRGDDKRAAHTVINGENLFALELLTFLYPGEVDCIYIDPPFNTGARDWRYNNDYIDKNDTWRHSKWVAMMARRLKLAARLLKTSGILVAAIDENEHASLTLLLADIFPQCEITSVAIVQNPRGIQGDNFSFTNEFAVFVVPKGQKLIAKRPKDDGKVKGDPLRNWGGESLRTDAATCFYPILVRDGVIVGFGDVADDEFHPAAANEPQEDGTIAVWPVGPDGEEHKWRYARDTVESIRSQISVRKVRGRGPGNLRVLLVDDHEIVLEGLRALLEGVARVEVVGQVSSAAEAVSATRALSPDVIVLDNQLGDGSGVDSPVLVDYMGVLHAIEVPHRRVRELDQIQDGAVPDVVESRETQLRSEPIPRQFAQHRGEAACTELPRQTAYLWQPQRHPSIHDKAPQEVL